MFKRFVARSRNSSFFLFGAGGTGKSTFIERQLLPEWQIEVPADVGTGGIWHSAKTLHFDLLNDDVEESFSIDPKRLKREIASLSEKPD